MARMSELPASDSHDVIRHGGEVVAVVVPIAEYRQLRQALEEQRVNEEFDAARVGYPAGGWDDPLCLPRGSASPAGFA